MNAKTRKILFLSVAAVVAAALVVFTCLGALVFTRVSEGVVPTESDLANAVVYQRVLFFGVDGAGNYFDPEDTPNFYRIFGEGNINLEAWSQFPTTSAHNWTSMMHGVRFQTHLVDNNVAAHKKYSKTLYPSIFKMCAQQYPDAKMISLTPWQPINYGIIEDMDNLIKYSGPTSHADDPMLAAEDAKEKDQFIAELRNGLDPKLAFMYFAQVDEYGHAGGRNEDYYQALRRVDGYLGEIYDEYRAQGLLEGTLFVLATDHGHVSWGGHGGNSKTERTVTVAVAGDKGNIIAGSAARTVTQDVASIILYALGIQQPATWESKVPFGLFNTLPTE